MRVLLVEDDSNTAQSIELMLKSENFIVDSTDLGEDGLEIGKLYETIFSAGGTVPTGVGMRDEHVPADDEGDPLTTLTRLERGFGKALREEVDSVHHQERTRAILRSVAAGSDGRLDVLREMAVRK